jgi:hypothetical protein
MFEINFFPEFSLEGIIVALLIYFVISHTIFFKVILELNDRSLPRDSKEKQLQIIRKTIEETRKRGRKKKEGNVAGGESGGGKDKDAGSW